MSDTELKPILLKKLVYPFQKREADKTVEVGNPQEYYDALAQAEDGFYPIGANGQWHGGIHFGAQTAAKLEQSGGVRCIADGEVIAYRIDDDYPNVRYASAGPALYSTGFVLVRHRLQLPSAPKTSSGMPLANEGDVTAPEPGQPAPVSGNAVPDAGAAPARSEEEPSLLFYSLYMHLLNWKGYQQDSKLERPAYWGETTYLVGEKAGDSLRTHPGNTHIPPDGIGLNLRDTRNRYVGFVPRGTRLVLGGRRGTSGYYAVTRVIGTSIPADLTGAYVYKNELTPAGVEPAAKSSVVVLDEPYPIKAGEVVGHLGQYQRYIDMDPLGGSCYQRPLVQVDVFTGQDLGGFIVKSRERAAKLPDNQKTLLCIEAEARLVLPIEPDLQLTPEEGVVPVADSPQSGPWVKVRKGTLQVEASRLPGYRSATRTYGNGATLSMVLGESDTDRIPVEVYSALSTEEQKAYPRREVLPAGGSEAWAERTQVAPLGVTTQPIRLWSKFPLDAGSGNGPQASYRRVVALKQLTQTVTEADGTRWWEVEVGAADGGTRSGWVRERDHSQVTLCTPWDWPGFEVVEGEGSTPAQLYARQIEATGQAHADERQTLSGQAVPANAGPMFSRVCEAIDQDNDKKLTPDELRKALKQPWLADTLSRLIVQHESEWAGPMSKWDGVDALIPESRKADWAKEKERIGKLLWWHEVQGRHGFPSRAQIYALHPIGFVGNFNVVRVGRVTAEMLKKIFPSAPDDRIKIVVDGINLNIEDGKLDTEERITHFFGQVRQEVGPDMSFRESLLYSADALFGSTFSYYRGNRERSDRDARNEEAIANNAYDDKNRSAGYKLGNTQPGDGWRYRGRGLKQLTGRTNYRNFTVSHQEIWGEYVDLEAEPDKVNEPLYAVRSGLYFWVKHKLYLHADKGITRDATDSITSVINKSTKSYGERWGFVSGIWAEHVFRDAF